MVVVFTRTTSVISPQFLRQFTESELRLTLIRVSDETGVQFCHKDKHVEVIGQWADLVVAQQIFQQTCQNVFKNLTEKQPDLNSLGNATVDLVGGDEISNSLLEFPAYDDKCSESSQGLGYAGKLNGDSSDPVADDAIDYGLGRFTLTSANNGAASERRHADKDAEYTQILTKTGAGQSLNMGNSSERDMGIDLDRQCYLNVKIKVEPEDEKKSVEGRQDSSLPDWSFGNEGPFGPKGSKPDFSTLQNGDNVVPQECESDDSSTDIDEQYLDSEGLEKNVSFGEAVKVEVEVYNKQEHREFLDDIAICNATKSARKNKKKFGSGDRTFSCTQCDYITDKRVNLKSHLMRIHRAKQFSCDLCDKEFAINGALQSHIRQVHLNPGHFCSICGKSYRTEMSLMRHREIEHGISPRPKVKLSDDPMRSLPEGCEVVETDTGCKSFKCSQCKYTGKEIKHIKDHIKRMHNLRYSCDTCGKQFGQITDLNCHKKRIHPEKLLVCPICKKFSKTPHSLTLHMQCHKVERERFNCEFCPKSYLQKCALGLHVRSVHSSAEKELFMCSTCGKSFKTKLRWRQHEMEHITGYNARRCICEICGQVCASESSLKRHKLEHEDLENRFTCEVCSKQFKHLSNLRLHMKIHQEKREHICTACGKEFYQKQALQRHERIHTGDKPFVCSICQRPFRDLSIIRRHLMLIHKIDTKHWKKYVISLIKKANDKAAVIQQPSIDAPAESLVTAERMEQEHVQ